MATTRILIIDDEPQIRRLLKISLEAESFSVLHAETGREGILLAANHKPDLILLDLGVPDIDGMQVLHEIRNWTSIPIIIISVKSEETAIITALDSGADDYLVKPFRTGELKARINANLRRHQILDASPVITNGHLHIDLSSRIVLKNSIELKLTNTEYQLLVLFLKNIGKVLTIRYILNEIWGTSNTENAQSLRVFVGSLRKKTQLEPSKPDLILTESGVGYRMKQL